MHRTAVVLSAITLAAALSGSASADDLSCQNYAEQSLKQIAEAERLNCERTKGEFWAPNQIYHYNQCMKHKDAAQIAMVNLGTREAELEFCRKQMAAATPEPAEEPEESGAGGVGNVIKADVDLYAEPGGVGKPIGMLTPADDVALVRCRDDNWCQVTGGWVWGDFVNR
jgi:hypothetical protein